jgi:acetyltransferase-like isoleucine patch superfamily enzyme
LQAVIGLLVIPRIVLMKGMQFVIGGDAFRYASESIARLAGMRGVLWRQAFYKKTLSRCGKDVYVGFQSVFSMREAELGDRVYIGRFCSVGFAKIGDEVMLADHVQILSGGKEHILEDASADNRGNRQSYDQVYRQIRIGKGSWIGAGAVVMADVGERAIVGAGAVVTRPVASNSVVAGVPAKAIVGTKKSICVGRSNSNSDLLPSVPVPLESYCNVWHRRSCLERRWPPHLV